MGLGGLTSGLIASILAILGMMTVISFAATVMGIVGEWKVFEKAGFPGWHCIVPVLRDYDFFGICWDPLYGIIQVFAHVAMTSAASSLKYSMNKYAMAIAFFTAAIYLVLDYMHSVRLARCFGKGTDFALGLLFLKPVFLWILGFGNYDYDSRKADD